MATDTNSSEWPTDPNAYILTGKIGQGAFASVWRATASSNEETRDCAVKVLNLDHVDTNLAEIRLEVLAMRLSLNPNVLTCHTAFVNDTNLWLVTQLMRKGSSLHCIQTARETLMASPIPMEPHIMYILHETLLGLKYIHDNGQIHRDVKSSNILIDADASVRIADFGVSGFLVQGGSQQEKAKTFVGTPCWMAPEVMEQIHGYDTKADVWSLGITALELAKGYAPYAKYPPMKVLILTIQEDPPSLETYDMNDDDSGVMEDTEEWTKSFQQLIAWCLEKNPAKRPSCQELLQSKYFSAFATESFRDTRLDCLKREICDIVDDVGTSSSHPQQQPPLPGTVPVSIVSRMEENRPAGTTWVFADGSQVLASSAPNNKSDDDVFDELDAFGENYARENEEQKTVKSSASFPCRQAKEEEDESSDLEDFMTEFEQTTGGEHFRGPGGP
jgi:serine/threonine-protein kinase OSR1/STK39